MSRVWPETQLADVLTPVSREERVDASREYRLLGVRLDGQGPFLRETVLGTETSASKLYRVAAGDFIYSRLFAWRGAFGVIEPELDGCYVSGEFPAFAPKPDKIDVRFLRYWFRLSDTLSKVTEDCSGSTPLTRNRFKEQFFLALEIPLPPLAEQLRIVARIEALASKIAEAGSLCKSIEEDERVILYAAFHRIAVGAPRRPMSEVAPLFRRPINIVYEEEYPQIAVRSFGRGAFHKPPLRGVEITWQKPYLVKAGDILISNIKAWEGAVAVATEADDGRVGSHRYLTCAPIPGVATARFVCFYLLTEEGLHLLGESSPGSADRNRTLSAKGLMSIPIPMPPYEEQTRFGALYGKVDELKRLQAETAAELDAMLPAILDRAFKGEL